LDKFNYLVINLIAHFFELINSKNHFNLTDWYYYFKSKIIQDLFMQYFIINKLGTKAIMKWPYFIARIKYSDYFIEYHLY